MRVSSDRAAGRVPSSTPQLVAGVRSIVSRPCAADVPAVLARAAACSAWFVACALDARRTHVGGRRATEVGDQPPLRRAADEHAGAPRIGPLRVVARSPSRSDLRRGSSLDDVAVLVIEAAIQVQIEPHPPAGAAHRRIEDTCREEQRLAGSRAARRAAASSGRPRRGRSRRSRRRPPSSPATRRASGAMIHDMLVVERRNDEHARRRRPRARPRPS